MHLVIIGFDDIVINKYMEIINKYISNNTLEGYYIFDLESQKYQIEKKLLCLQIKPTEAFYLNVENWKEDFTKKIRIIKNEYKVYIATEARWHYFYLEWCIRNKVDVLVEKPVFVFNGTDNFEPDYIVRDAQRLIDLSDGANAVSVMSLGRYHKIYNELIIDDIRELAIKYKTPITSIHLRHAGGVWNLINEFDEREDHPYKYGYGMIMHGGYHYIDLVAQVLEINKSIIPTNMTLELVAFSARPYDQNVRISGLINDIVVSKSNNLEKQTKEYGETDIAATFRLYETETEKTITLGNIALEQTTPSIRKWSVLPTGIYNKNGRVSSVDFEVQLSTLASDHVVCYDIPVTSDHNIDRIDACADVIKRRNANIIPDVDFVSYKKYTGLFHSDSNKKLMEEWILGNENKSALKKHSIVIKLMYLLSMASKREGEVFKIDI